MTKINKEMAFAWLKRPNELPKENLVKLVCKTTLPTVHPEDSRYMKRIFPVEELKLAARSLIGKPIGLNHVKVIPNSIVLDSEWNPEEKQVESLGYVPLEYTGKVKAGNIGKCSVEYSWRKEVKVDDGISFEGLNFLRVDLLENLEPGDPQTSVTLFEAKGKKGRLLGEAKKALTEENKDQEEPVEKPVEPSEEIPIEEVKEVVEDAVEEVKPETPPEQVEEIAEKTVEELHKRVTELEESISRLTNTIKEMEKAREQKITEAKEDSKQEVIKKIEAVIPTNLICTRFNMGAQRLLTDIKRVIYEAKKGE